MILDHKSEAEHLASIVRDSAGLKTSEEFKGLLVRIEPGLQQARSCYNGTLIAETKCIRMSCWLQERESRRSSGQLSETSTS